MNETARLDIHCEQQSFLVPPKDKSFIGEHFRYPRDQFPLHTPADKRWRGIPSIESRGQRVPEVMCRLKISRTGVDEGCSNFFADMQIEVRARMKG